MGVAILDKIVNHDLGWLFRRQDQATDHGIDAQIEVVDDDRTPTGRLLAVQIKSGAYFFRRRHGDAFVANVTARHLRYWLGHSLPVLLILVDVRAEVAFWHLVQEPIERTPRGAKLYVPVQNRLRADSKHELRAITQTPAQLKAERDAAVKAARQARLSNTTPAPLRAEGSIPLRITEHDQFLASLRAITDEVIPTVSVLIERAARAPIAAPVLGNGARIVKTRPYQGKPGVRLTYIFDEGSKVIHLLHAEEYWPVEGR